MWCRRERAVYSADPQRAAQGRAAGAGQGAGGGGGVSSPSLSSQPFFPAHSSSYPARELYIGLLANPKAFNLKKIFLIIVCKTRCVVQEGAVCAQCWPTAGSTWTSCWSWGRSWGRRRWCWPAPTPPGSPPVTGTGGTHSLLSSV